MTKIQKVKFINHPILGNLELDFCGADGKAVDTIIIAGENGVGKSVLLNSLYGIASGEVSTDAHVVFEKDDQCIEANYAYDPTNKNIWVTDNTGFRTLPAHESYYHKYGLSGIFSDVAINFRARDVSSVTSMTLDASKFSRRSDENLPTQIKQLIIDVQALDDAALSNAMRNNPTKSKCELNVQERMPRFTSAFGRVFDGLTYHKIDNVNGHKEIYFRKNNIDIPIDQLSTGEKQVLYRGCFLLKDVNATNGAIVFIDEPEISLHPTWQMKIMDYYKGIFTDENGNQTSQIFAATHSPFIIHNDNRRNDKVIVLARDENGIVVVKDRPEYFKCNSVEAVQDAFSIPAFSMEEPTVFLEGRTDEKYFNKAVEVFGLNVPFRFKWVGYLDDQGQEVNTGDKSIDAALQFLAARNLPIKFICLKDCDTHSAKRRKNNVIGTSIQYYENSKGIRKGIENALILDGIDLSPFYTVKSSIGDYGEEKTIQTFNKMNFCDTLCDMDNVTLKKVFANLKSEIDKLIECYNEE